MSFLKRLEQLVGRRALRVSPPASEMEELSRAMTREPVELEPPVPKLRGLTTNDVDMTTGQPYPDYLERRRLRAEAKDEPVLAGTVKHDVRPD
jgi:hypothetical protein